MNNQEKVNKSVAKIETAIDALLAKYNEKWVGNEGDMDQQLLSEVDNIIYESLFDAREILKYNLRIK